MNYGKAFKTLLVELKSTMPEEEFNEILTNVLKTDIEDELKSILLTESTGVDMPVGLIVEMSTNPSFNYANALKSLKGFDESIGLNWILEEHNREYLDNLIDKLLVKHMFYIKMIQSN